MNWPNRECVNDIKITFQLANQIIEDIRPASVHGYCAAGLLRPWLSASVLVGDSLLGWIGWGRGQSFLSYFKTKRVPIGQLHVHTAPV